jgi:P27 family predicted phage terminase small subunit
MRGRKPKPLAQQISAGDPRQRGKQKLKQKLLNEPSGTHGIPDCPEWLQGDAREEYDRLKTELELMGLDRLVDAGMVECAAAMKDIAKTAYLAIKRDGLEVEDRAHSMVSVLNAAATRYKAFASELGASPVSRTRLTVEKKDSGEADLLKLLGGAREPRKSTPVN